jgi:thiosulfate/3-mercaptopyruvate sulfurtransferase
MDSHIPGAIFVDIARDLSSKTGGGSGRHPLPTDADMDSLFSRCGIGPDTQVVIYDASYGAFAARMWWMLRYRGHHAVAVLDGGWQGWLGNAYPVERTVNSNPQRPFRGSAHPDRLVRLSDFPLESLLVDSREPDRFRGISEPIDPVAGHVPGAVNYFWKQNIDESGRFRPAAELREKLLSLLAGSAADDAVFYCGSGVTACHNLLAACYAGLAMPRLYAGSWSEWCSDPGRPVATERPPE